MNYLSLGALILFPLFIYAQTDTSKIKENLLLNDNESIDTTHKEIKPLSILHLKTMLDSQLNNLKLTVPNRNQLEDEFLLYDFSKEELNSGLSKKELIAYKKNKEQFRQMLQQKYDEGWWYRVKSLGELLGISDWVIRALEFALLFGL
jgi:hypothetical protein